MRREHPGTDLACLGRLVMTADKHRGLAAGPIGGQRELQAVGLRPDHVGQPQHGGLGAVVPGQPDHAEARVGIGEGTQMRRVRAAEPVNRLGVIADAGQAAPVGREQPHDVGLHRVDVLVLVDEDRVEEAAQDRPGGRIRQRRLPQQQQVVEVNEPVAALVRHVVTEEPGQLGGEIGAPGKRALHDVGDDGAGVHAAGVDVGAYRRARRAAPGADQIVLLAQRVQHVRDVSRVDHAELRRQ